MARKAMVVKQERLAKQRQKWYEMMKEAKAAGKPTPVLKGYQPCKFYNRCGTTGKVRGYMREFGVSRQAFRRHAREGVIMGLRKASW
jgi:small subunit ribosomal protein S14